MGSGKTLVALTKIYAINSPALVALGATEESNPKAEKPAFTMVAMGENANSVLMPAAAARARYTGLTFSASPLPKYTFLLFILE